MSDTKYIDVMVEAIGITVEWKDGKYKARAGNLPPGSPIGYDLCWQDKAILDLIAKIMCGTYRHKANKLIDTFLNRNPKKERFRWSYEFLSDEECKVIVTDRNGKEDSVIMKKMAPKETE